jgi:hypothetical protein
MGLNSIFEVSNATVTDRRYSSDRSDDARREPAAFARFAGLGRDGAETVILALLLN